MSFRIGRKHASHTYPEARSNNDAPLRLAHGFDDNFGDSPTPVIPAGTILASVTVTPKVTGKFKLSASCIAFNSALANAGTHTIGLQFGHGGLPDYPSIPRPIDVLDDATDFLGLEAESGSTPYTFVAPIGIAVTFNLIATCDSTGDMVIPIAGAQLTIEELPN